MIFSSNNPFKGNELETEGVSWIDEIAAYTPKYDYLTPFPQIAHIDDIIHEGDEDSTSTSSSPSDFLSSASGLSLDNSASLSTINSDSSNQRFPIFSKTPIIDSFGILPDYNNDSDISSLLPDSRSSTPPTPVLIDDKFGCPPKHIPVPPFSHLDQLEYLQFVEPQSIKPPNYNTLAPGGCPKYPIIEAPYGNEKLPDYTPLTYKICIASRKVEWLSPYEPSPQRSWKLIILELNSTQFNVYSIPQHLEQAFQHFRYNQELSQRDVDQMKDLHSLFTTIKEFQLLKFCQRLGCINDLNKNMARSYSLQHAKIGLASDYKKKPYVLRLRIESEQILLSFNSINDLIEMNLGLTIGRDLALDLNERECPRYRTVPRRRSRRSRSEPELANASSSSVSRIRVRAHSDPSKILNTFSKIKSKFKTDKAILSGNPNTELRNPVPLLLQPGDGDDYQEDVEMSDLREDMEEDDDDDDEEVDSELSELPSVAHPTYLAPTTEYSKWDPSVEKQSEFKFYKNCLRCIKPLTADNAWVSRSIVKPASLSPLNLAYLLKVNSLSTQTSTWGLIKNGSDMHNGSGKGKEGFGFHIPDSNLTKVPDHFLKEYIVGAHGLIPRELQV